MITCGYFGDNMKNKKDKKGKIVLLLIKIIIINFKMIWYFLLI